MNSFSAFYLIGRPTMRFDVVGFYFAAGCIESVKGVYTDDRGKKFETCARVADVVAA